ncbi:hypothetical protein ACWGQ5_38530 [Streptomyces sp. NPDC055722]
MSAPGFEPLESLPPARRRIAAALFTHGWERADIEEALDCLASELAEEIRKERDAMREEMKGSSLVSVGEVIGQLRPGSGRA